MWNSGNTHTTFSLPGVVYGVVQLWPCAIAETTQPWVSIAALGRPVVPPVYCSSATSSHRSAGAGWLLYLPSLLSRSLNAMCQSSRGHDEISFFLAIG